jgi:hypothetical protein
MAANANDVAQQLAALTRMAAPALRVLWRETFGRPHPGYVHKDFLVRALSYHIQEKAYGGLKPAVRRRLLQLAKDVQAGARIALLETPQDQTGHPDRPRVARRYPRGDGP